MRQQRCARIVCTSSTKMFWLAYKKGVRVSRSIREDCSTIFLRQHQAATNCLGYPVSCHALQPTRQRLGFCSHQSKHCLVDATDKDDCTSNAYALKFCLRKSVRPQVKTRILMSVIALPKPRQARISRGCNPVFGVTLDPCD
jgi:hypothetical protein